MDKINVIILAGGKSHRMGQDKGLIEVKGKAMIQHTIDELKKANVDSITIISNNPEYEKFGVPVYPDLIKDKGPLGGIYTGLHHSKKTWNIISPCDSPLMKSKYFELLSKEKDENPIQILKSRDNLHFLIGIVHNSIKPLIKSQIETGDLSVKTLVKNLGGRIINTEEFMDYEESDFTNVNSPKELELIESYEKM